VLLVELVSKMSINCSYYSDGRCVYVNGKYSVFEKCIFNGICPNEKQLETCINKKTIEGLISKENVKPTFVGNGLQ